MIDAQVDRTTRRLLGHDRSAGTDGHHRSNTMWFHWKDAFKIMTKYQEKIGQAPQAAVPYPPGYGKSGRS
jgi:hypothetical protein